MPHVVKPLARAISATLLASTCFAGPRSAPLPKVEPEPASARWWNLPIAFALEARTVERTAALGIHVVRPLFAGSKSTVLVEGYGYEGEGELGLAGGGLVYRRSIGSRSAFETSAFFEGVRSADGFSYPQLGAGFAFSPDRWVTIRANGYLPLRGKDSRRDGVDRWTETTGSGADRREVSFSRELRRERDPMRGFDVEAELRLPEPPRWVDPRIAVGYSYREAEDRPEIYAGVTARGALHLGKHWVAEAEWRDDMHGAEQEWRVGLRFQMLFGGTPEAEVASVSDGGKTGRVRDGKSVQPAESGPGAAPQSAEQDARDAERFLPVQRFPWPTVARGRERGNARRGDSRLIDPVTATPQQPAAPDDCCPSAKDPLIYD